MMRLRLALTLFALSAAQPAFAYIDPGSGMLIWQGAIAALGAVLVLIRNPWGTIKRLWQRFRHK